MNVVFNVLEMIPVFEEAGNKLAGLWVKYLSEKPNKDGKVVVDAQNELNRCVRILF